jgi:hypothetical protein
MNQEQRILDLEASRRLLQEELQNTQWLLEMQMCYTMECKEDPLLMHLAIDLVHISKNNTRLRRFGRLVRAYKNVNGVYFKYPSVESIRDALKRNCHDRTS